MDTIRNIHCLGSPVKNGGRGGNRTHNHRLRRPVLYPIELLARIARPRSVKPSTERRR